MRLDLAAEWRSRRWRRLLNVIDHLPRDSAYMEALSMDEEFAAAFPPETLRRVKPKRRMSDWSPTVEMLSAILDRLGEVVQATAALGGSKPRKVTPAPRPETAADKVAQRRRMANHHALVARVLPGRADGPQPQKK